MSGVSIPPRAPIMLRGYYIRTAIMRDVVRKFLRFDCSTPEKEDNKRRQIVNLGAGFDTLFFWMQNNGLATQNVQYYELDFLPVFQRKVNALSKQKTLLQTIGKEDALQLNIQEGTLHSPQYNILPTDLRDINLVTKQLLENKFDTQ